jgi:hypothetical protein
VISIGSFTGLILDASIGIISLTAATFDSFGLVSL